MLLFLLLFIYKTRLASKEIFSPPNEIYREEGRAMDLSAPRVLQMKASINESQM